MLNVSKTGNKSALLLIAVVIALALVAYLFLFQSDGKVELTDNAAPELDMFKQETNIKTENTLQESYSESSDDAASSKPQETNLALKLLGVVVSDDNKQNSATIESELNTRTYYLNERIASSDATLIEIFFDRVLLRNEKNDEIILMLDKSAPDYGDFITDNTSDSSNSLTTAEQKALAKSIGNRPKELEHIVNTTPLGTEEGSDGFAVGPGLNPSLFRSAGFKEGDILKEINGLDLSIAEQYALAMAAIPNAHTLEFTVIRGGRTITLYLDIPSEGLSMDG
jgi:general secretion pathway protein C